jgi:hypothetical protein
MIRSTQFTVTTTGADGSATGTGYSPHPLNGELLAIYVDWAATAPAGTSDIAITVDSDDAHPAVSLYSKSDSVTDAWVYPVVQSTDTAGTGVAGAYQHIAVAGRIKAAIAGCNALSPAATITVYLQE